MSSKILKFSIEINVAPDCFIRPIVVLDEVSFRLNE